MIKANKNKVLIILLGTILISGWFYWFQYRPAKIRRECSRISKDKHGSTSARGYSRYKAGYEVCLHGKGL